MTASRVPPGSRSTGAQREVVCRRCGATNGLEFATCIRCAKPLLDMGEEDHDAPPRVTSTGVGSRSKAASWIGPPGWAGMAIAVLCTVVFAAQLGLALQRDGSVPLLSMGDPADFTRMGGIYSPRLGPSVAIDKEPWRLLTAVFVHFGVVHYALNMYGFLSLSRLAERLIGSCRVVVAFAVSGVAGFAATFAVSFLSGKGVITAGASGAILGVMGIVLGVLIRRKDPRWKAAAWQTVFYTLMFGFAVNASNAGIGVNNTAHMAGLACGVLFGLLWGKHDRRPEGIPARVAAIVTAIVVIGAFVAARTSPSPQLFPVG